MSGSPSSCCRYLGSVEGLELVGLHRRLILVEVREGVFCPVVMRIVVRINGLSLKARNRVEFFDSRCAKARKRAEHCTLDLRHLGVLHGINQRVLRLCSVVLELLRSVLLTEWRNLVEVHLKIVGHLLRQVILRRRHMGSHLQERATLATGRNRLVGGGALKECAEQLLLGERGARSLLVRGGSAAGNLYLLLKHLRAHDLVAELLDVCRDGANGQEGAEKHRSTKHDCVRDGNGRECQGPEQ